PAFPEEPHSMLTQPSQLQRRGLTDRHGAKRRARRHSRRLFLESLEDRTMLSIYTSGTVLVVNTYDTGNTSNRVRIDTDGTAEVAVTLNGVTGFYPAPFVTNIDVYAGASNASDTVNVDQTLSNVPVTIWAGDGTTNVNFSAPSSDLDAIQGSVEIAYSSSSQSTVTVNDQSNTTSDDWNISSAGSPPTFGRSILTGMP